MRMKKWLYSFYGILLIGLFAGCGKEEAKEQEITFYAAKSLNAVSEELIALYQQEHPEVKIRGSYDSSGTLMEGILNGHVVDIFFSASKTQMNQLEKEGLVVEGSEVDLLNNQVCVVTYQGSGTKVKGLQNLEEAKSIALADGSVPVGKYTREALVAAGLVEAKGEVAKISTMEISEALGNVTINECGNVGAVVTAVMEGANEVGTVYYSDVYGKEDSLEILEMVSYDLTGNVIYPVAQIKNERADKQQMEAVKSFLTFLQSDEAKKVFEKYHFDVID